MHSRGMDVILPDGLDIGVLQAVIGPDRKLQLLHRAVQVLIEAARLLILLESGGGVVDERPVLEPLVEDLSRHGVRERDISAHVEAEPQVHPLRRRRSPRVDGEEFGAVMNALEDVVKKDRMRLAGVRPPQ